jgi:uncharacterized protein (DUF1778 family)
MRQGAQERGESLTDFIIRSACAEAELTLADQRRFLLNTDQWNAFVAALDRPARPKPRLRRLFAEPSVLGQEAFLNPEISLNVSVTTYGSHGLQSRGC